MGNTKSRLTRALKKGECSDDEAYDLYTPIILQFKPNILKKKGFYSFHTAAHWLHYVVILNY